jgi:glyceraldehyde-3-phosphate dehydrogenase (NADP+)
LSRKLKVTNPYDSSLVGEIEEDTESSAVRKIEQARESFPSMREMSQEQRAGILTRAADAITSQSEDFARTLVLEVGKTIREARTEVARCVNTLRLSAVESLTLAGREVPFSAAGHSQKRGFFRRVPCGVVTAITPFNFPLNLAAHKLGPAIAAGCSVIFKPASATPFSGIKLVKTFIESGIHPEALQVVVGPGSSIGKTLTSSPIPRMITFTGSRAVGREITKSAGIKKLALELGSNSAVILLSDADIEKAAKKIKTGGYTLAGQVCISTQRVYVEKQIYKDFLDLLLSEVSKIKTGDPMNEETDLGPMIESKEVDRVLSWIAEARKSGAEVILEGQREGNVLCPWILANVGEEQKLIKEEAFAPLVVVNPVDDLDDAIAHVNASDYGLQAACFTNDIKKAFRAADSIDAGGVLINELPTFRADLMPYGGMKDSGLGREGPSFAVREMTEEKLYLFDIS